MEYVVGSIAALISGNVTPNRPKLIRRALTPTKHQQSPNVTPKSEFVDDRSIFLSPSLQKKKAIVKKSPKRIFANPDLDITENSESSSPNADKVKKHLKEDLEAEEMVKSISPSNKLNKSLQPVTTSKHETNDLQNSNENTPKKKKRKSESVADTSKVDEMDVDKAEAAVNEKTPKKKERRKSAVDIDPEPIKEIEEVAKEPELTANVNQEGKKKKKRKKNKANTATNTAENKNGDKENKITENTDSKTETKSSKKKKNRKKNKKSKVEVKTPKEVEQETANSDGEMQNVENDNVTGSDDEKIQNYETPDQNNDEEGDDSDEEVSNIANPNAITEKDTDSEHDSDDEIESENEEANNEVLKNDDADESSDDEAEAKTKKGAKTKKNKKEVQKDKTDTEGTTLEKEVNTEDEVKRTLFVGNVPFSNKCKKEIKKIFAQYGDIETVRIRTVPVKDGRVTPKLAVIKNEIHPDRSTVNVYVKFTDPDSVERALAENNTVLNKHHLRVSRSASTGVEHDPRCAVFLGNLPFGIEDETLRDRFHKCGDIHSVRIVRDKKTNAGKGFGYVNFTSKDGVELALSLSEEDLTVKNRIIRVKRCTQALSKGLKNTNKSAKPGPRKDFGNNQGQNRNFGNNQNRSFGNQNRNGPNRSFGNNQGQSRNFGNDQGPRNFGNNQGPKSFGNNQGPRNFGGNQNRFGNQGNDASGASRRIMNKRPHQESGDGPPNKKQHLNQPPREKKQRKEFVGVTAEKKKKQKFDKNQKKKKAISEIMTKK